MSSSILPGRNSSSGSGDGMICTNGNLNTLKHREQLFRSQIGICFYLEAQSIASIDRSLNIFRLAYRAIPDWPDPASPVTVTCTCKLPYPDYVYYIPSGIHSAFSLSLSLSLFHPSVLLFSLQQLLLFHSAIISSLFFVFIIV